MSVWFWGSQKVACGLDEVARSLGEVAAHHLGIIALMPGLTSVELVDQRDHFVTILVAIWSPLWKAGFSRRIKHVQASQVHQPSLQAHAP